MAGQERSGRRDYAYREYERRNYAHRTSAPVPRLSPSFPVNRAFTQRQHDPVGRGPALGQMLAVGGAHVPRFPVEVPVQVDVDGSDARESIDQLARLGGEGRG